jgi:hypothetical protein
MCYERRRAEACVDESAHHALVNDPVGIADIAVCTGVGITEFFIMSTQ